MRFQTFIHPSEEERVEVHARSNYPFIDEIRKIVDSTGVSLIGYRGDTSIPIDPCAVDCFLVDDGKVYALIGAERYQMKERLYQLEELPFREFFVKINQSCYANIKKMQQFRSSIGGSILVIFENGHSDYVARRELKNVKARIGL